MAKIRPFLAILVRNSETKSLKIDPKVPNRPSRKGLQTGHWQNPGSYSKKRIFGPKMAKIRPFWAILVRNSETKTLKIDPKVPNRPSRKGLQTGHWQNSGSYSKKRIFGPKTGPVAGKRPAERPNGHLLGAWGQFFSEYRQVGYPERRNDMPWSYSIVSVHIEPSSKRKWPKPFFWGHFF